MLPESQWCVLLVLESLGTRQQFTGGVELVADTLCASLTEEEASLDAKYSPCLHQILDAYMLGYQQQQQCAAGAEQQEQHGPVTSSSSSTFVQVEDVGDCLGTGVGGGELLNLTLGRRRGEKGIYASKSQVKSAKKIP